LFIQNNRVCFAARYRDVEREPLFSSNSSTSSGDDPREYYSPFHTPEGKLDLQNL